MSCGMLVFWLNIILMLKVVQNSWVNAIVQVLLQACPINSIVGF